MASGDVVNTAARLQSCGARQRQSSSTRRPIARPATPSSTTSAEPVEAKGKAEPIPVWQAAAGALALRRRRRARGARRARRPRARARRRARRLRARPSRANAAARSRSSASPASARAAWSTSSRGSSTRDPELITWRQGRCLAYGDGVTLWALGEIVKAQAGILEQDAARGDRARSSERRRRRCSTRRRRAAGSSRIFSPSSASRRRRSSAATGASEAFAAWRRFLEGLAEQRPLVLVFEDLHWADESLLDFVDELVDWVSDVPLLVVATARPELLERRPGWGGGKLERDDPRARPALGRADGATLSRTFSARPVLAAESQQTLLERAGGNPLYAEQFAELYLERGSTDELPLPETLQGIIAARLDGLAATEKAFSRTPPSSARSSGPALVGATRSDADAATLHSLERKGFVRRQRRSSVEGESEFAFAHALVRDVAYGQIPRADRAPRHRSVAEWIESLGRPEDHAEMLAYHWRSALELARATGRTTTTRRPRAARAARRRRPRVRTEQLRGRDARSTRTHSRSGPRTTASAPDLLFRRARRAASTRTTSEREDAWTRRGTHCSRRRDRAGRRGRGVAGTCRSGTADEAMPHTIVSLGGGARRRTRSVSAAMARVLAFVGSHPDARGRDEEAQRLAESALAHGRGRSGSTSSARTR